MRLWAISDLHVGIQQNREVFKTLSAKPDDTLILAGDMCESLEDLEQVFSETTAKFKKVLWVPGNHELWSVGKDALVGVARYEALVDLARRYNVLTPEDPYMTFESGGKEYCLVPMFLLYDYSFNPHGLAKEKALAWAGEHGIYCADESLISSEPFASVDDWCRQRVASTYAKLKALPGQMPKIFINHFQLRYDVVTLGRVKRFSIWCGTQATENWHKEFNAEVVISGHLHVRSTLWRDDVRFEEVSLGNPGQYHSDIIDGYLRLILPYDGAPADAKFYVDL